MDGVQQQLMAQAELSAAVAQEAAKERTFMSRQVEETGKAVAQMRLERLAEDLDSSQESDRGDDRRFRRHRRSRRPFDHEQEGPRPPTPQGPRGHGHGEMGPRREAAPPPLPKMHFPEFHGNDPVVWIDNCLTYFSIYSVPRNLWVISASLHLKENAARWYQVHKIRQGIETWENFTQSVLTKFGAESYPKAMRQLLKLRQQQSLPEYNKEFEEVRYRVAMHNSELDDIFFVEQYVKGLKFDLQGLVQAALPTSVNRAMVLAEIQQDHLDKARNRTGKAPFQYKSLASTSKAESQPMPVTADLSKERQVREYRRLHGLCYACGERFEPGHLAKCAKRNTVHLHALTTEDLTMELSDTVLEQLQQEDETSEQLCHLSLNALSRNDSAGSIKVRALLNNLVILILVDSGSSTCFINSALVAKAALVAIPCSPVQVTTATGDTVISDAMVKAVAWKANGHTFRTDMRVLDLGPYDAILGFDWLSSHSPMQCNWEHKTLQFLDQGVPVQLHGDSISQLQPVPQISGPQLNQLASTNEIWSCVLIHHTNPHPPPELPLAISSLLAEFQDIFSPPSQLPPHRGYDHHIPLIPGAIPVNTKPYRYSPFHKTEIEKQVQQLLETGLITCSVSPFASPVLLVQKKDGTWRLCVDYRKLNTLTIKNRFPMPLVEEILDELAGATLFSSLDMTAGYHQIRMQQGDEHKTAFKTHHGHYEFRVMPFGLTNAPATFQCTMNSVLAPFLRKFAMVFIDDILIYSATIEDHLTHLRLVLTALKQHQFFLKQSKCSFAKTELSYLGHIITAAGVATDPSKVSAMLQWPVPTNFTELRGFLGLTGYYRRFVQNYGLLAKPLTTLLRQKQFHWSETANTAFQLLKTAMTSTPVLTLPRFDIPFEVETDASDEGLGAVLMQQGKPVAYLSKALGEKNKHLSIYEKEFLALIMAVDRWRQYLQRTPFTIKTDHQALSFLEQRDLQSDLQRKAMTKLMGLNFKIVYRKGKENKAADALSRIGHSCAVTAITEIVPSWIQEVTNSYATDPVTQDMLLKLAVHSPDDQGYSLDHGLLKRNHQVWIGNNSALRTKLLSSFHASAVGGHSGTLATYHRIKKFFYWKGLKQDVIDYVKQCSICQHAKTEKTHPAGLLQPLPIPTAMWTDIAMDFVEGLPNSEGFNTILVVVDRLSKMAHFIPLKHPFTALQVAQELLDQVIKLHGIPKTIVSDRDRIFTSNLWQHLFARFDTKLLLSTAYHPQTDGQSERVNQCLEMYLRCAVADTPKSWKR